ncbi:DUF6473 family protein [Loktanella sp. TSTF-M6]|uniref:DUF6473 family protein n=1 Tax=Loktanella gaetbuli TaxID=2881335 RepID=A0ABS8BTT9_9RHOB|nr:DUF6473 family protein [Loktanella gaetbuli]MCB5198891.1 DUF6473 family protein [Loktanella gaetbuli]
MKQDVFDTENLDRLSCRYGMSRLQCRGPQRSLDGDYIAFVGGTETYGKLIDQPFPARVEHLVGMTCVNFGCVNAGVDAFVNDPTVMRACAQARMTVVQVMGANYLSNRFYSVHPRRNDRFLRASTVLQAIYPEVDFSNFTFTRHMLGDLLDKSADRFDIVVSELRAAWVARMRSLLGQIGPNAVLLWFSTETPDDTPWQERSALLSAEPLFVNATMIDALRPLVHDLVVVQPPRRGGPVGMRGMFFSAQQRQAVSELMGPSAHADATVALTQKLGALLGVTAT